MRELNSIPAVRGRARLYQTIPHRHILDSVQKIMGMISRLCLNLLDKIIISKDVCIFISWYQKIIHKELQNCILNGTIAWLI